MFRAMISLNNIDGVKEFNSIVTQIDCDMDLMSGRYVIDAKSIMGVFSLDLSKPIEYVAHVEDGPALNEIKEQLAKFFV